MGNVSNKITAYGIPGLRDIRDPQEYFTRACTALGVNQEYFKVKTRKRPVVYVRAAIARGFLRKCKGKISLDGIGKFLGGKDHATIIHYNKYDTNYHPELAKLEKTLIREGL